MQLVAMLVLHHLPQLQHKKAGMLNIRNMQTRVGTVELGGVILECRVRAVME